MRSATSAWIAAAAVCAATACAEPELDSAREALAPGWLLSWHGAGTWTDPETPDVVYAWVDARVANVAYHKRVWVEVAAPYPDGMVMRTLLPASYRYGFPGGSEKWGTDAIEIYPDGGPNGTALAGPVMARLRMQYDGIVVTDWQPLFGDGAAWTPDDSAWVGLDARGRAGAPVAPPQLLLAPFDDPGAEVIARIDAIIAAQRAEPSERHTLFAAVYNITDPGIVDKVIEAHEVGVEVRLLMDGRKFRPWYDWYTGDDRLLAAGVPLLGVRREASGAMHDKIVLFDGQAVATGSFNWEYGARFENHENMIVSNDVELVAAYGRRFEALAGGVLRPREHAFDPSAEVSVSFAPDEEPYRVVGRLIDDATTSIYAAMFTAKDVVYWEDGVETSILRKLVAAHDRGVDVRVIVDYGIHEASEYHGVESEDDPTDEWLEEQGVHVVRADNPFGPYASMHHKMVVIDDEVAVTGAFNWYYDAAYRNDEDQLVWRDPALAARFRGEIVDLLRRYDDAYDASEWPHTTVHVEARHDHTAWGDGVTLVGDLPELGSWDPGAGLSLDPSAWPLWSGTLSLPGGVRLEHKLVVDRATGGVTWERGANRRLTVPADVPEVSVTLDWRD